MMKYQHWKSQTSRGVFSPRSKLFKSIDDALESLEKKPGTPNQVALVNAVDAWIKKKGAAWKNSTRNSKIETGGKGTVETLIRDLLKLNPQYARTLGGYLTQHALPPPPLLGKGMKKHFVDADGHHYEFDLQGKENSCGPASIRIVIKLVKNENVGEDYLRELVEVGEEGGAYIGSLGKGGAVTGGDAHDWDPTGSGTWLVPEALKAAKIDCTQNDNLNLLLTATPKKPAIAVVTWDIGGMHYVVVLGKTSKGDQMVVLDPYYGLQHAPFPPTETSGYEVIVGGKVETKGNWVTDTGTPWVCTINGVI